MKPLDPRLLRYARSTRAFLIILVLIGVASAALVVAQATLLADAISRVFGGSWDISNWLWWLAIVLSLRALLGWATEVAAHRAAASAKSQLRLQLVEHSLRLGPVWLAGSRPGDLAVLATSGVDALDAYFSRYLPQLVLAAIVPITLGVVVAWHDLLSAVIIALTAPLIPVFMILIGRFTQSRVDRQWRTMGILSGHFLDLVSGLATLKAFGRAGAQSDNLRRLGNEYRRATLAVLRVSFLSALVLELLATLSVALVAVSIGLRLVGGHLSLRTGLLVLVLAPEVYLPIRLVGTHFHAAAEGLGAADRVFAVLETPLAVGGVRTDLPDLRETVLEVDGLSVIHQGRTSATPADLSFRLTPGRVLALVGPSGEGKSTVLSVLLGFTRPTSGHVRLVGPTGATDLSEFDSDTWRSRIGYVSQSPRLFPGTLGDNIRLAAPNATAAEVADALASAGLDLPVETEVGEAGVGLSAGQVRRVAIARAFVRRAQILILDEPTASLDGLAEDVVLDAVTAARTSGTAVLVVAHRPSLVALADEVVVVVSAPVVLMADT